MEKNENGYSEFIVGKRRETEGENNNKKSPESGSERTEMNGGLRNGNNSQLNCRGERESTPFNQNNGELRYSQLAMVYSPSQQWRMLYTPEEGLTRGTLFEELYKPLEGC